MLIYAPCAICVQADQTDPNARVPIVFHRGRLEDAGYVKLKCSKGHETTVLLGQRKYETLFRSACEALIDQYDREAVSSFAAALERVYEFFIRVTLRHVGAAPDVIEKCWKLVGKQSERQFGMFVSQHAIVASAAPTVDNKMVEFRNKVIHQGYIPNANEAESFGEYVFNIQRDLSGIMSNKCATALADEIQRETDEIKKSAPADIPIIPFKAKLVSVPAGTNVAVEIAKFSEFLRGVRDNRMR